MERLKTFSTDILIIPSYKVPLRKKPSHYSPSWVMKTNGRYNRFSCALCGQVKGRQTPDAAQPLGRSARRSIVLQSNSLMSVCW